MGILTVATHGTGFGSAAIIDRPLRMIIHVAVGTDGIVIGDLGQRDLIATSFLLASRVYLWITGMTRKCLLRALFQHEEFADRPEKSAREDSDGNAIDELAAPLVETDDHLALTCPWRLPLQR
jgi:hypothetical protein